MNLSLQQYSHYFVVGSVVGISAVIIREVIALSGEDTATFYFFTVLFAYVYGIIASFYLHKQFTFKKHLETNNSRLHFYRFTLVAIIGMFLTCAFSLLFRYAFHLDSFLSRYSGACAFILATLSASVITFYLNVRYSICASVDASPHQTVVQGVVPIDVLQKHKAP